MPKPLPPLIDAILSGDDLLFRARLADVNQVNAVDRDGRAALHHAVIDNKLGFVAPLLRHGADVALADKQGWTALHFAAQNQSLEATELLLAAGAPDDAVDAHGNTPLFRATVSSRELGEVIRCLLVAGADRNKPNKHGNSPLKLAKTIANYNVAQFF